MAYIVVTENGPNGSIQGFRIALICLRKPPFPWGIHLAVMSLLGGLLSEKKFFGKFILISTCFYIDFYMLLLQKNKHY
jgi:hypothetical protein